MRGDAKESVTSTIPFENLLGTINSSRRVLELSSYLPGILVKSSNPPSITGIISSPISADSSSPCGASDWPSIISSGASVKVDASVIEIGFNNSTTEVLEFTKEAKGSNPDWGSLKVAFRES